MGILVRALMGGLLLLVASDVLAALSIIAPTETTSATFQVSVSGGYYVRRLSVSGPGNSGTYNMDSRSYVDFTAQDSGVYTISYSAYTKCYMFNGGFCIEPDGRQTASKSVTVALKPNTPPSVSFTEVTSGSTDRDGKFKVNWGAAASTPLVTGYQVQQQKDGGSWTQIYSAANISTRTVATGLLTNGSYKYQVRAYTKVGTLTNYGSWRVSSAITVNRKPDAVGAFTQPGSGTQSASFQVAWAAVTGTFDAVTRYELQCSIDGGAFTYSGCGSSNLGTSTSKLIQLTEGTEGQYKFRARACNGQGCGGWSPEKVVPVNIPLSPPGVPQFSNMPKKSDFGDYDVQWTAPTGTVTSYELQKERLNDPDSQCGSSCWKVVLPGTQSTLYPARGEIQDKYRYRVRACNDDTCSGWATSGWIDVHNLAGIAPAVSLALATTPGTLDYSADVTQQGDAVISVPLQVAPGVNGMVPNLGINYSGERYRQRNNEVLPEDILGYGWRLSGFGEIRRCVKGRPNTDTIQLDNTDSLCLNGEPLVLVSGSYWQAGSLYRTLRESFELVELKETNSRTWFRVSTPDGRVNEYGNTPASRLRVGDSVYFGWSLNKSTDAFGNSIQYAYHRDTVQGINYPLEVTYGNGGDARIEFQYGTRTDAPPQPLQPGEIDQEQLVLLHHINVYLDGKLLREYRLITEEEPANPEEDHYRRLKQMQLCAYDESGLSSDCLNPLVFNWLEPEGANPLDFKTGIGEVIDGLGKSTRFYHALISENPTDVQFGERPFGEGILPADASELQPVDGEYRYVVGEVHRSNGFADGWHITSYSYQGVGLVSSQNWGFLGYYAQKAHDQQSDIVTYRQFRLDFPHFGETARVQQYLGNSDDYLQKLSDQKFRFGETALAVNGNTTYYTYPAESLETVYEQDQVIGYRYNSSNYSKSAPGSTGEILDSGTRTQKVVTEASVSDAQTFWGEVQTISTSGVVRSQKAVTSYLNRTSPWLVGFVEAQEVSDFNGDTNTAADRVQTLIATPFGNSNNIGSVTRFPGDPNYELIVSYNYDGNGNVSGETTSGVNIDTRSLSATSYIDKRYPATITNALSQNITISYDSRFGSAKNVTDANNRTTTIGYDPFGREVTRTNPDGVVFDTDYTACSGGSCPVYGNMLAAYRVTTNSPITPTADRYYDLLGRIVQQDIASFNGSTVSRREYNYDNQGRLYLETAPYFDGQYKPLTIYEYDVRDRIVKVDRPDNSEVRTTFTALLASNQVQVAIAEDVYDADGAYLETHTKQRLFNLAGDLVKTIDAVGTGKEVTTAFTYNGSGLALSAMVDNSPATKSTFVYDKAGYRISLTDPNLGTVTSAYDAFGQLAGQIDNKGQAISYLYDKLGRLAEQTDADGVASWIYDPANAIGQLAERSYADGGVQVFRETYNYSSAKLQSITTDLAADGYSRSYQHSYGYDGYGRLERVTYPSNAEAYYQYNSNGYLEQITDGSNPLKTRNSVNALGYAEEEVYGNNLVTTRSYNPQTGQLESISTAGASHIQNNEYRWRSNGTLQSRLLVDGGVSKLESFSYDALNRLTSAATYFDGVAQRTLTTQYDKLGNILSKSSSHPSDTNVTGYQYGQGGNAGPNAVSQASIGGVAHNLYYDANGAITRYDAASGDDKWITWNARQLPVEITLGESQSTQTPTARDRFQYGPNGQRFYRETSWLDENQQLQTERAFYVGKYEDLLPANDPDYQRVQKARIDSNIVHIAATDHPGITVGTLEYLHRDHLGSIDKVTDEAGVVILNTAFDPFGKRRNAGWQSEIQAQELKELLENQGLTTKRGFTGHEHLDRTGLIHMNGRIYDPQLGRFLSPDPFVQAPANSQSWNRYSYVMNAPLERTDPSGYTSIRSFYDLGGGGGGGFDGWPVNVIGSPITADWNEFKGGYGSSGSGGSFGGNPGNDRGGSSGSASGGNQSEDKDTEKAKEQANVSPNGTTYEDEVVVTATKEGSGTSGFKSCLASCLQINYGETYEWAESVSPVSVQGFLTNEAAEALHDKALREANRNAWQASNQKAFETGMRQLSVVKLFARFNAAAAVAGAGAAGFQVGALGYCSVECVGE